MLIRKWIIIFSVFLLSAVLSSGCLFTKTPAATPSAPPAIFVDYHRTGGFAGLDDRLVIFDNGDGIISSKSRTLEISVNQTELIRLSALFDEAQFSMLKGNYTSRRTGSDFIQYSISYHSKTVKTEDSAVPPALQPVIDELNGIVSFGERTSMIPGISRIPA
jgi:hypothetical protein